MHRVAFQTVSSRPMCAAPAPNGPTTPTASACRSIGRGSRGAAHHPPRAGQLPGGRRHRRYPGQLRGRGRAPPAYRLARRGLAPFPLPSYSYRRARSPSLVVGQVHSQPLTAGGQWRSVGDDRIVDELGRQQVSMGVEQLLGHRTSLFEGAHRRGQRVHRNGVVDVVPITGERSLHSQGQGWPQATRRPPEGPRPLTPTRTAPPSPAGMPTTPPKCNYVSRHLLTMSRDITGAHSRIRTCDTGFRNATVRGLTGHSRRQQSRYEPH